MIRIKRSEWCKGYLHVEASNQSCAMGHYLHQALGIPKEQLDEHKGVYSTATNRETLDKYMADPIVNCEVEIVKINDSNLPANEREQQLIELFTNNGVELEFYD